MKTYLLSMIAATLLVSCGAKENENQSSSAPEQEMDASLIEQNGSAENSKGDGRIQEPFFSFSEDEWDFGVLTEGEKVSHTFKFNNTGGAPLVISNVSTTCGCTVPEWPKDPIQPGDEGEITVTFDSNGKAGNVTKDINIIANTNPVQKIIRIKAQVQPAQ
jgi:hypothetical protein